MFLRALVVLLTFSVVLGAQAKLTVAQLKSLVTSSAQLQHPDKQVAAYLRKVVLTERLDEDTLTELQALRLGQKTREALNDLAEASRNLPPATPPAPKPAPPSIPPPPEAEQSKVIEEVRDYALNYTKRLPDFICSQVTRRYVDPTGLELWRQQDTVVEKLSFFEQKEKYEVVLVNNRPNRAFTHEQLGGATSSGEFGTMMKEIFEPETQARFTWERWARLRGRRMQVYNYRVSQARSKWEIDYQRQQRVVPAYSGLIFVDNVSHAVMRITLQAEGIPPSFPIQEASNMLDYDYQKISGADFVLPLRALMRMREGKYLVKNEAEFRLYRKFGAEASISFDTTPEPLSEDQTREEPVTK